MMFMLKSTHKAEMYGLRFDVKQAEQAYEREVARCNRITAKLLTMTRERDAARDDLSMMTQHATRLQAEIDRIRAPLIAANRRRAEDAKARREAVAPVLKAVG